MAIPKTIEGREYTKFVDSPRGHGFDSVEVIVANTPSNPVPVEFSEAGEYLNQYFESNSVAGLSTTNIIDYTVPVGKEFRLNRVDFDGGNVAIYKIDINSSTESKKRTYYTKFNGEFIYSKYTLNAGDNLKLIVENNTNMVADFNANMQGRLIDV